MEKMFMIKEGRGRDRISLSPQTSVGIYEHEGPKSDDDDMICI